MSQAVFDLTAVTRTVMGKGASRRLRRQGNELPGIVYGAGKEPTLITLNQHEVRKAIAHEAFFAHILNLDIDGNKEKVVVKAIQRHPHRIELVHMDFQRIDPTHMINMTVPLHFINSDKPEALKRGAVISHNITEVEIRCLPSKLPEFLELDVAGLGLEHPLHLQDIKCPAGVEIIALSHGETETPVATMYIPRAELVDEPTETVSADVPASKEKKAEE